MMLISCLLAVLCRAATAHAVKQSSSVPSDSYSSWMYSVTLGLVEVPYVAFSILVFITPYYFMVGFNNDASDFFKFYLAVFMLAITLSSLGQWAGATFPSFVAAIQASGMLVTFWFLFGGVRSPTN